jgi:hypothetical protein
MAHDERYEAVLASIGKAMAEANALGWQGHEREAHVFLSMFDAAENRDHIPAPEPEIEPVPESPEPVHDQLNIPNEVETDE